MCDEIDRIYIIGHPEYEKERIEYVCSNLLKHGFSRSKIGLSCPTWGNTLSDELCWKVYDPYIQRPFPCINFKCRWLLKGEISLVINFFNAIQDAAKNGYQRILVLESDVMFRHDFAERFKIVMEKARTIESWSYISLSDGVGTHSNNVSFGQWYAQQDLKEPNTEQKHAPFRCTDSMIFNRPFIEYLSGHMLPFRDCLDWELNSQIYMFSGKAMWAEPHLIEQATQKRISSSSLRY